MKKSTKISLIVASILLVVGLVISAVVLCLVDHKELLWNPTEFEMKTQTIENYFENIRIHTEGADIRILPAEDALCRVEYPEAKYDTYEISTNSGVLSIQHKSSRKWYQFLTFSIFSPNREVRLYLPKAQYEALTLTTASGDIAVDSGFTFSAVNLSTASGSIACHAGSAQSYDLKAVSGDVLLHDAKAKDSIRMVTTSGSCTATNLKCADFYGKSTSGDVVLANITADELSAASTSGDLQLAGCLGLKMELECTSGDIAFSNCDGNDITMIAVSGDIEGSFASPKLFEGHSASGDVSLPKSEPVNSRCTAKSTSGDIHITIA